MNRCGLEATLPLTLMELNAPKVRSVASAGRSLSSKPMKKVKAEAKTPLFHGMENGSVSIADTTIVVRVGTMSTTITRGEHYSILDELFVCCDEHQFRYQCNNCEEVMDCQFCGFDPYAPHECIDFG